MLIAFHVTRSFAKSTMALPVDYDADQSLRDEDESEEVMPCFNILDLASAGAVALFISTATC